jgi:hypothetical protein
MSSDPQGAAAAGAARSTSDALRQLKEGEISLDQYLDYCADTGIADLKRTGLVKPEQLEFLRQLLRDQLTRDPVLVELVRRTTGKAAEPASVR